jgi:hypothetical protein
MPSSSGADSDPMTSPSDPPPARRRPRQRSRTRQLFLGAINAQITGTRVLALLVLLVLLAGGAYWLVGTTGSRLIGVYFLVLAAVLVFTIYSFIQVMYMFTGRR